MPLFLEIIAADGSVTRVPPERGLARVDAQPGATYRIVDDTGAPIPNGARVLRYETDLVVVDLPGNDQFEVADFFGACTAEAPCQFSLAELGGAPGEVISPDASPIAALTQGGFLMAAPGLESETVPTPPESDFDWKPIAGIAGGLAIAGAGLGGGGGGGEEDTTPPVVPTLKTSATNDTTPVLSGTAEPGSQVTVTLNPGGSGELVTFTTTTAGDGTWSIDTGSEAPTAGAMPDGGLPVLTPTTIDLLARDAAGNLSSVASSSVTIDITPPNATATLTGIEDDVAPVTGTLAADAATNDNTPRLSGTIDVALESGDRVQILRDGVVVGEATVTGLSWAFTDGPLDDTPGTFVSYSARVADAAGNTTAETAAVRISIDTAAPPAPTLAVVAGDDIILQSEAAAGVTVSGSTIANGTVRVDFGNGARDVTADAVGTFSTVFQAADLPADGTLTLTAVAVDAAGNESAAGSRSVLLDRTPPSLSITSASGTPFNGTNTLTFTFDEPVSGFTADDITVGGGASKGAFNSVSATTYTLEITPPATSTGTATVVVAPGVATDTAGNGNTAASFSQAYDTAPPTPVITDNIPSPTASGPITFTFDFGESVSGFTAGDISVTNGTASGFSGSGAVYSVVVTPTANASGTVSVDIANGAASDAAGNPSQAASASQAFDTDAPTVQIVPTSLLPGGGVISPAPNGTIEYTLTFSEPVSGLTLGDIIVVNGLDSNLSPGSGPATVYTVDVTPDANEAGNLQVTLGAGTVQDGGGADNEAGASVLQPFDTLAPTLSITDDTPGTASGPVTYTFTFSEAVTGFTATDVTVSPGAVRGPLNGSGASYTMAITPPDGSTADLDVSVGASRVQDASGNENALTSAAAQPVDTVDPVLTITAAAPAVDGSVEFTFDFVEDVTGFTLSDIDILSPASALDYTVSTLDPVGGGTDDFTLTLTPDDGTSGLFTVSVDAGVAQDAAGNPNTADAESQAFTTPGAFVTGPSFAADPLLI